MFVIFSFFVSFFINSSVSHSVFTNNKIFFSKVNKSSFFHDKTLVASNLPLDLEISLYKWKTENTEKRKKYLNSLNLINKFVLNSKEINFNVLFKIAAPLKQCRDEREFYIYLKGMASNSVKTSEIISANRYKYEILFNKKLKEKNFIEAIHFYILLLPYLDLAKTIGIGFVLGRKMKGEGLLWKSYVWYKYLFKLLNNKFYTFPELINSAKSEILLELAEVSHKSGYFEKSLF